MFFFTMNPNLKKQIVEEGTRGNDFWDKLTKNPNLKKNWGRVGEGEGGYGRAWD